MANSAKKEIESLLELKLRQKANYLEYLNDCIRDEDWHGVQDAGSDLQIVEDVIKAYRKVLGLLCNE